MTLKVSSHKHHEFQWHLYFVTFKSHLWAEYSALRSVKPANATPAPEHTVFLYLQTWSQSLWKARSLLLVEVDPGFYGNCWILRTWNAICGLGTEMRLRYLDRVYVLRNIDLQLPPPTPTTDPTFWRGKIDTGVYGFCQAWSALPASQLHEINFGNYKKTELPDLKHFGWVSAIYSRIYVQEKEDRKENLHAVWQRQILSYLSI